MCAFASVWGVWSRVCECVCLHVCVGSVCARECVCVCVRVRVEVGVRGLCGCVCGREGGSVPKRSKDLLNLSKDLRSVLLSCPKALSHIKLGSHELIAHGLHSTFF